jgi:hypothetical protein
MRFTVGKCEKWYEGTIIDDAGD